MPLFQLWDCLLGKNTLYHCWETFDLTHLCFFFDGNGTPHKPYVDDTHLKTKHNSDTHYLSFHLTTTLPTTMHWTIHSLLSEPYVPKSTHCMHLPSCHHCWLLLCCCCAIIAVIIIVVCCFFCCWYCCSCCLCFCCTPLHPPLNPPLCIQLRPPLLPLLHHLRTLCVDLKWERSEFVFDQQFLPDFTQGVRLANVVACPLLCVMPLHKEIGGSSEQNRWNIGEPQCLTQHCQKNGGHWLFAGIFFAGNLYEALFWGGSYCVFFLLESFHQTP